MAGRELSSSIHMQSLIFCCVGMNARVSQGMTHSPYCQAINPSISLFFLSRFGGSLRFLANVIYWERRDPCPLFAPLNFNLRCPVSKRITKYNIAHSNTVATLSLSLFLPLHSLSSHDTSRTQKLLQHCLSPAQIREPYPTIVCQPPEPVLKMSPNHSFRRRREHELSRTPIALCLKPTRRFPS